MQWLNHIKNSNILLTNYRIYVLNLPRKKKYLKAFVDSLLNNKLFIASNFNFIYKIRRIFFIRKLKIYLKKYLKKYTYARSRLFSLNLKSIFFKRFAYQFIGDSFKDYINWNINNLMLIIYFFMNYFYYIKKFMIKFFFLYFKFINLKKFKLLKNFKLLKEFFFFSNITKTYYYKKVFNTFECFINFKIDNYFLFSFFTKKKNKKIKYKETKNINIFIFFFIIFKFLIFLFFTWLNKFLTLLLKKKYILNFFFNNDKKFYLKLYIGKKWYMRYNKYRKYNQMNKFILYFLKNNKTNNVWNQIN